jgi:hypothetical protein
MRLVRMILGGMATKEEALAALDASPVRTGQRWQHFKGHEYTIIGTGIAEATLSPVVIYGGKDGVVWVRSLDMFVGNNDEGAPRFTRVMDPERPWRPLETSHSMTDGFGL